MHIRYFLYGFLCSMSFILAEPLATQNLNLYKDNLIRGTYDGQDFSYFKRLPLSRYDTFRYAFDYFERNHGKIVVELGTTRSFVDGRYPGCNSDDISYWEPSNPERWDWGAGFFTYVAAVCLSHLNPHIHTVDIIAPHIERSKLITSDFKKIMHYHVMSSEDFLKVFSKKIDLLYMDTGDMTPIEDSALLHLREAHLIVERDLIAKNGLILIDDVRNPTPKYFGEKSDLGKAKYSLPYFLEHGFELVMDEYQVILKKL